jgi:Domain of unknown function (DUF4202)
MQLVVGTGGLTATSWLADDFDFWAFDRRCDDLERLVVEEAIVDQVRLRTQRLAPQRSIAEPWFERVHVLHRGLHDLDKPLVRADYDHALDAWQWTLRLDAEASPAVQLATLLHDVERLASEADARVEHQAADYQAFKDAHALAGAAFARRLLERAEVPRTLIDRAVALVELHERRGNDREIMLVNDADALSFFSLNSPGYLAYFGLEQTRKKVDYTLARMSPAAREWLPRLRVPRGLLHA